MSALADDRLVAIGQRCDEVGDVRRARGGFEFAVGRIGLAVPKIVRDGVVKEIGLLRDDADVAAQRLQRYRAQVVAVDEHAPVLRIVKTRNELGDRRLARARRPDEGGYFAGSHVE